MARRAVVLADRRHAEAGRGRRGRWLRGGECLEREFGAFSFLRRRGFTGVPVAHLADEAEQYAVYSLEPGRTKAPPELTLDELAAIGRLAAGLHRFRPAEPGADFPPAFASRSLAERVDLLRRRLAGCMRAAAAPDAYEPRRAVVAELDLPAALERLIAAATAGPTTAQLGEPVPDEHLRFNTGDFAPHNILVRPDGTLCAIDFEYFGRRTRPRCRPASWPPSRASASCPPRPTPS